MYRDIRFTLFKGMKDANETEIGLGGRTFGFSLYEADSTFQVSGAPIETTNSTTKATVNFKSIQFTKSMIDAQPNGDFYYVIKEENAGKTADGVTNWDGQVNIKLHAEVVNDSVVFKAEYYRYQSAEDMEAGKTDNTVRLIDVAGEEFTLGRVFNHYNAQAEVQLGAKKLLDGKAPKNDQFRFTLTEVADKDGTPITPAEGKQVYTDTKTNDAEGNVVFDKIRYAAFDAGTNANGAKRYYKITEEQNGAQGIDYDSASYVVTVTIQDDGKGNLTAVPDKSAEDIVFNNTTQTGKLQLKKTILGDITEEEAEGALTFTVKNEDGKYLDKDGNLSDTEVKLTLKDFDHKKGTKEYTLEFQGIKVGDYTVTETTKDITGKDVTVAYKLNGGETQTGVEATAGVTKNETTTVAFEDDYTDQTGNLQLTKTIQGDVTEAEAEGALTFTVKNKDGKYLDKDGNLSDTEVKLTLKDFDHKEGTKEYTLEFKGIKVGNYTVTETTKDITGKDVTVSYKLNGGEAQTGAEATAGVTKNETTTVA
ncbi:MAG: hypothetical protein IJ109_07595, partial [Firmicutes bacterium]|nr:hypothetical protein [Bacillota bacterium]